MTIRERFERLQRYHAIAPLPGEVLETLAVDDVLALADKLDKEHGVRVIEREREVRDECARRLLRAICVVGRDPMLFDPPILADTLATAGFESPAEAQLRRSRKHLQRLLEELDSAAGKMITRPSAESSPGTVTDEKVTEFSLACHSPESRLEILRKWCRGCGGPAPCNCERDE